MNKDISKRQGSTFAGKWQTTARQWTELEMGTDTHEKVKEIRNWLHQHKNDNTGKQVFGAKHNYRVLFNGETGTAEAFAATLVDSEYRSEVYRVDLSQMVSKYIGETEKNLRAVFKEAENKNWILFFDEADALFGKRTNVKDSHDRYANQQISYLLQQMEDYHGLVIIAGNFKDNLDDAFTRRFNSIVHFHKRK